MVIPKQYNHYIYISQPATAHQDANGDYVADQATWQLLCMGREETNGAGEFIETDDMRLYKFSSLVQMPVGTAKVQVGTRVVVSDTPLTQAELRLYGSDGQRINDADHQAILVLSERNDDEQALQGSIRKGIVRIVGTCHKFDKGQLHCRMWL